MESTAVREAAPGLEARVKFTVALPAPEGLDTARKAAFEPAVQAQAEPPDVAISTEPVAPAAGKRPPAVEREKVQGTPA